MAFLTDARGVMLSDQASLQFAQSNMTYVEPGVYRQRFQNADYGRHLTVTTAGPQWAATATWQTMGEAGEAEWFSGNATDAPYVEVTMDQHNSPNYGIWSGFKWTVEELNQALLANVNMSNEKPMVARRKVERKLYKVAMTGDTTNKGAAFTGLINDGTVTAYDVAATGTGSSTLWNVKTPDQILYDVNTLLGGIQTATAEVDYADTLRLPPSAFRYISSARIGSDSSMTILEFLRRNNVYTAETQQPLDIGTIVELESASDEGEGRMIAYRNAPDVVDFWLPMPFQLLPVRSRSIMSFEGAGIARTGGTRIKLPAAIRYADRITDPTP